jgi:hypothetical protein
MPGLSYKARTTLTVWRLGLWRYRLTVVGVLSAIWGAATSLSDVPTPLNAGAGMLGLLLAAFEIRANRLSSAELEIDERRADQYDDLIGQLPPHDRVIRTATDVGVLLGRETDRLLTDAPEAKMAPEDFELHRDLKRYSYEFLARRARKGAMHNDPILGLASDIPVGTMAGPVLFQRAMYFDFVCSNLLAQNDVHDSVHQSPLLSGRRLFIDRRNRLRSFTDSRLANTVGVSTLAITTDGQLLLIKQTSDTVGSPGLYAPSGSGALEPKDLVDGDATPTVCEVVLKGAERELREECNLGPDCVISSDVIGHARWISRGAMPEFAAVTLLNVTADEVTSRGIRRSERAFVHRVHPVRLSDPGTWNPGHPLDMLPAEDRTHSSWPLALALSCLADRITDQAWVMRKDLLKALEN